MKRKDSDMRYGITESAYESVGITESEFETVGITESEPYQESVGGITESIDTYAEAKEKRRAERKLQLQSMLKQLQNNYTFQHKLDPDYYRTGTFSRICTDLNQKILTVQMYFPDSQTEPRYRFFPMKRMEELFQIKDRKGKSATKEFAEDLNQYVALLRQS